MMTLKFVEDHGRQILRQLTADDWRKAELHCIQEEDRLMNIDLRRNQRAEEEAAQAAVDEDQDDDYVPNSSQNEDDDNSFFLIPVVLVWMMFLMSNYIYLSVFSFEK